jgi:hypothetical protein
MADHTVVSRLLAPGGLASSASLVVAAGYLVGYLPGLVLARLARLAFLRWAPHGRRGAAPQLPGGRPLPKALDVPGELGH